MPARLARFPLTIILLALATRVNAQETIDTAFIAAIHQEIEENSRIMETANQLTTVHGPRLNGSPQLAAASQWSMARLKSWGAENVSLEPWGSFGRGWEVKRFWINAVDPIAFPMIAYPQAWSSGTEGSIRADVVIFDAEDSADFGKYRGRLAGKIVLDDTVRTLTPREKPLSVRHGDGELVEMANAPYPPPSRGMKIPDFLLKKFKRDRERYNFLLAEKPAAILFRGDYGGERGVVFPDAALAYAADRSSPDWFMNAKRASDADGGYIVPQVLVSLEHYNRLHRLVKMGYPMEVEMDLSVRYQTKDTIAYNVIAEIPGEDPVLSDEVVMLGAHLDSWHGGTGATDNAAGCSVMMEVMRVLRKVFDETGKKPRRTIRLALWSGEEGGLRGSIAYVDKHYAGMEGPSYDLRTTGRKPGHESLSAYYNLDHGTGRIRGIYLEGDDRVMPIFRRWLEPFREMGASTLTLGGLGGGSGSDHMPFAVAGIPSFMFIQDILESRSLTHHSTMDEFDHLVEGDLKQAAEIVASFVYHTAQRDAPLPRKTEIPEQ